ncbi:MAG: T9SS type A sorting domain-containing protein [Bacteroidota bacterium]
MKHFIIILFILFLCGLAFSQNRLILNNDIYAVIDSSSYLVIGNSAPNAISTLGTGGNIISEGEMNRIKWDIGTNTGIYTIPFTKSPGNKIPLTANINTTGIGTGCILFSTYGENTWDNFTYMPSDVTHMNGINTGVNNSDNVIDRFWIIDAIGYTTKPTITITFTYLDTEWSASGNSISEANLFAQRFDPAPNNEWHYWYGPFGTANTTANTVSSGNVTPANFFRSWTLVDQDSPLPVELLYFTAIINSDKKVLNQWATVSEINNDYFIVERTLDGINYEFVSKVAGAGNSNSTLLYSTIDPTPYQGVSYYRLKQVDNNGLYTYSQLVSINLENIEIIIIYPNPASDYFEYLIGSSQAGTINVTVVNELGQTVIRTEETIDKGITKKRMNVSSLSSGIYMLRITTDTMEKTQKQFIVK